MALFKISKGLRANLPSAKTAGYCWYTVDDSLFYIDYEDENGEVQRKALNAKDAETLSGASLATILNSSDIEIPTSRAVLNAIESASGWTTLMDVTLEEECVDVIGITLTDAQKEKIANGGEFVCYAQCPPPSEYESNGWIEGGLWADNMYYFMLSTGKPSNIVPSATENYTLKFYFNFKNVSGDMRIRDMFYHTTSTFQVYEFVDTTTFMNNYQTQSLTVRFKTSGMFAVGTRLICKVR